jgi:NADH-quinone oxidoreductase subunit J
VAFSRNIIYSAFSLLGTLLGVGAMFVYLSADFLAVTQLLIYVGGVLVLILFAIMLTNQISQDPSVTNTSLNLPVGAGMGAALAGTLCFVGIATPWKLRPAAELVYKPITADLGNAFLQEYLLLFEVASVILLAALIGAVVMAKKEVKSEDEDVAAGAPAAATAAAEGSRLTRDASEKAA